MQWNDGCDALVDFVEEHGGSMGGETRDHLFSIVQHILDGQAVLDAPQEPSDEKCSCGAVNINPGFDYRLFVESLHGKMKCEILAPRQVEPEKRVEVCPACGTPDDNDGFNGCRTCKARNAFSSPKHECALRDFKCSVCGASLGDANG